MEPQVRQAASFSQSQCAALKYYGRVIGLLHTGAWAGREARDLAHEGQSLLSRRRSPARTT